MNDTQLTGFLLMNLPVAMLCGEVLVKYYMFNPIIILIIIIFSLSYAIGLLLIAEIIFIRDCRKGYCSFDDSIFPVWIYK